MENRWLYLSTCWIKILCVSHTLRKTIVKFTNSVFHYVGTSVGSFIWISTPVHRFGLWRHGHWFRWRHNTGQSAVSRSSLFPVQFEYRRNSSKSKSSFMESVKAKVWRRYLYIFVDITFTDSDSDSNPDSNPISVVGSLDWNLNLTSCSVKVYVKRVLLPQIWDLIDTEKRFKGMTNSH